SNAVDYTYTAAHQMATRTWARSVTTTYDYHDFTGQLTSVDYSDATPDLAYTHTRTGQIATVSDVTGTRTFAYDDSNDRPWRLETVTLPSAYYGDQVLTRLYDNTTVKGRSA